MFTKLSKPYIEPLWQNGNEKYTVLKVLDHLTNVEQTNLE